MHFERNYKINRNTSLLTKYCASIDINRFIFYIPKIFIITLLRLLFLLLRFLSRLSSESFLKICHARHCSLSLWQVFSCFHAIFLNGGPYILHLWSLLLFIPILKNAFFFGLCFQVFFAIWDPLVLWAFKPFFM
ncbi:hypothetical protein TC_0352 [Chlamydia muridarum str. Nigg]|uniref:Uncharacterized protein n=1 Tax=Chlamydia muridarum (strain MoPn / Nigg) TaxID=243161 RepID=Q9PKV9_CHLMU|nr:hypothetical protein TC_0352 [Chlamydia muridarum str. Nigg]